jgi:hypothetical protein
MKAIRWGVTTGVMLVLSAWVGAQAPERTLPAADRARLFQHHRVLAGMLVDHGLDLAASRHPLDRAEECQRTARTLGQALHRAAQEQDASRLNQLSDLLGLVIRDGLAPTLHEAARLISPQSPEAKRLRDIRDRSRGELAHLRQQLTLEEAAERGLPLQTVLERLASAESQLRLLGEEASTPASSSR